MLLPLLANCGVEQSIYDKCHHNIIHGSLNLNISLPPPYYTEVQDFKNIDPVCIQHAISLVNWNDVVWNDILLNVHCVKSVQIRSFLWSVFSRIRTEYGELRSISPYSVQMRENTDQKNLRIWTLFTQWCGEILLFMRL